MLFPVSGVEVGAAVPPLTAFGISFFASMGGISGAFLLLPFQMSVLGYTSPSVSATNQVFNIAAIPCGVYRYVREQRMVWPLALTMAAGTLPGVFLGAYVRLVWLPDPALFKLFCAGVLLYMGARLCLDLAKEPQQETKAGEAVPRGIVSRDPGSGFVVQLEHWSLAAIRYRFQGRSYGCPTAGLLLASLAVGMVGGAYGIGGGAILAPLLVAWFGLPVHTISGAALMGTFLTSVCGVLFYTLMAPCFPGQSVAPDWELGLLFGLGGAFGMYLGARCQKFVPARAIKAMLVLVILAAALKYLLEALC